MIKTRIVGVRFVEDDPVMFISETGTVINLENIIYEITMNEKIYFIDSKDGEVKFEIVDSKFIKPTIAQLKNMTQF